MDALTSAASLRTATMPDWPEHDPAAMARDFLVWRHLRVLRARTMRHVHQLAARLPGADPARAKTNAYGVKMEPNWNDRTYAYCHYGTYGRYLADLIGAIGQPFAFLDIGANQGLFSLIAARNPACEAIVALEPVADTHARLARNLAANGAESRASALNFGLSDHDGMRSIAMNTVHSGLATLEDHLPAGDPHIASQQVETRTMQALDAHLPAHLPIFVKIDVEGHEAVVIDQLLQSPHAARVIGIFYEHDRGWSDRAAIEERLARAGLATTRKYGRGRHFDALATPVV
jgi:FkbM family methyltransferase